MIELHKEIGKAIKELEHLIPQTYKEDFIQDLWLIILEKPSELIVGLIQRNEFKFWLYKVIRQQINSTTSPYYTKYRKLSLISNELQTYQEPTDLEDYEN